MNIPNKDYSNKNENLQVAIPNSNNNNQNSKNDPNKLVFTNMSQKPEPDLHIISFDEYFDYVQIRKKRIRIFLIVFFSILLVIGLATFLTIYGTSNFFLFARFKSELFCNC
jgi:hypothetical protein